MQLDPAPDWFTWGLASIVVLQYLFLTAQQLLFTIRGILHITLESEAI